MKTVNAVVVYSEMTALVVHYILYWQSGWLDDVIVSAGCPVVELKIRHGQAPLWETGPTANGVAWPTILIKHFYSSVLITNNLQKNLALMQLLPRHVLRTDWSNKTITSFSYTITIK